MKKYILVVLFALFIGFVWSAFLKTSSLSTLPVVMLESAEYAEKIDVITDSFREDALVSDVSIVECTLSAGTQTECFQFTTIQAPRTETVGPWCPTNITDAGAEAGGMWLENNEAYEVDGTFVANLNAFYEDEQWKLYDEATGEIYVTDTKEACEAAARPDVDEAYHNHCVECQISYLEELPEVTYTIPLEPVPGKTVQSINNQNGIGIAFNGVRYDAPAPVDAILAAHTIAPFDDCGGHVNPHVGYHYHAATDCPDQIIVDDEHAPVIGLALDGYAMHTQLNLDGTAPTDLDECNGHASNDLPYHYHVAEKGANQILGCYHGESGCVHDEKGIACDASVRTGGRGGR
ncbi:MAG: YHYH protein [Candidatus Gracilibacteria bacterium]|nr:YHYH protein [Candidatus Gracilibacteria bacterium]